MLLRSLTIVDPSGPHNGHTLDLRIVDGVITEIGTDLTAGPGEEVWSHEGACASPGFVDIGAYLGDPGHEEREDVASLRAAALAGGYTAVGVLPDADPVRQSVADVAYLLRQNGDHPTDLLPLGALSKDLAGKDLTEMLSLARAGVILFTDGPRRVVSGSLLKRGLEYARTVDAGLLVTPFDDALAPDGQMHEGEVSTRLGLRGLPDLTETIPLGAALDVVEYTGGLLVVHLLSSAAGVAAVRRAKRERGLEVLATVSAHHLQFTDEELAGFDPNFKVIPPLRGEDDRRALVAGLQDGTIDAVVSHHTARHGEEKDLEFFYADFGALGLATAFRQALATVSGAFTLADLVRKFTDAPRLLLGSPPLQIRAGAPANITLFTTEGSSVVTAAGLGSKTRNSPLLGRELPGAILGVVNHGQFRRVG